jgi:ABC-type transport system involved in multi-copper enzyme maturation permease subunit
MGETHSRAAAPVLLHYRPWRGVFRGPAAGVWPVARTALLMLLRRRLFWGLYALGAVVFLMFFFGQYLLVWMQTAGDERFSVGGASYKTAEIIQSLNNSLRLDGSGETFQNYFRYEGSVVMAILALAGAILIGNDLRFGSLPFYLSKPLSRGHYLLGKGLAVAVFINAVTTVPAVILFVQYGVFFSWDHFTTHGYLLLGVLAYGAVITVSLTTVLLATAVWLRRTVPLVMAWTAMFVLAQLLASALVDGLHLDPRWRLIDLWNCNCLVGGVCLRLDPTAVGPYPQPEWYEAALVLGGTSLACLSYLILRLRAVEVVR